MALTTTTLSAACGLNDSSITVTSATGFAADYLVRVDDEFMQVTKAYTSGTTVPVLRGRNGSVQTAHVAKSATSVGTGSDWGNPAGGSFSTEGVRIRPTIIKTYGATATMELPPPGADLRVILAGTAAITLTIPVPTRDIEGAMLVIVSDGAAAHVPTFTGGVGGAGSGYDAFTFNSSGKLALVAFAAGATWQMVSAPGISGTVTNIIAGVA